MQITHEWKDGPELLIAYYENEECLRELKTFNPILRGPDKTGSAVNDDGSVRKSNRGVFIQEVYQQLYAECSPTTQVLKQFIKQCSDCLFTPSSVFQNLYVDHGFDILFSAYRDGDYYKAHRDCCKLTVLYWPSEKNFEGGDLYLPDFDYTIPYEPNKLIMFPSFYQHEVTPISTDQEGFVRYCASAFIN